MVKTVKMSKPAAFSPKSTGGKEKPIVRYPNQAGALRALLDKPAASGTSDGRIREMLRAPLAVMRSSATGEFLLRSEDGRTSPISDSDRRAPSQPGPRLAPSTIDLPETLGRILRSRRQILELSQADLAERAGVGRRFVSELEAGKPTAELGRTLQICMVLGLEIVVRQTDG